MNQKLRLAAFGLAIVMIAAKAQQMPQAADPQNRAGTTPVRLDLAIDAQGAVTEAKIMGTLPEPIRQTLEKRVAAWRFAPMQWQGKPVATRIDRTLMLRLAPTTSGGFAMQMLGLAHGYYPREYMPPPMLGSYNGFSKEVVFAYRVQVDEQGNLGQVEPLLPDEHNSQQSKAYSRKVAEWLPSWRIAPILADGKPVSCQRIYFHEHTADHIGTHLRFDINGWADEIDPRALPAEAAQRLRQEMDHLQNACRAPWLQTKIENVVL